MHRRCLCGHIRGAPPAPRRRVSAGAQTTSARSATEKHFVPGTGMNKAAGSEPHAGAAKNTKALTRFNPPNWSFVNALREAAFLQLLPFVLQIAITKAEAERVFGTDLPDDAKIEPVDPPVAALRGMAFRSSYDEGFGGHLSIPGSDGAAADFDKVLTSADALALIADHLRFWPAKGSVVNDEELVLFSGGVCNLHTTKPGFEAEWPSPVRTQRVVDVLRTPMALMHVATDMDQGAALTELRAPVRFALNSARKLLGRRGMFLPQFQDKTAVWDERQRDNVEFLFSRVSFVRPRVKDAYSAAIDAAAAAQRPIVFLPYSRATAELSGALRDYVDGYAARHSLPAHEGALKAKQLLRELVTVVSFGNADRLWPDGPAYVHVTLRSGEPARGTDPIAAGLGVCADKPAGAGADATFLHCDGIFNGVHSHSILSSGAPALRLAMAMNGVTTFQGLYQALSGDNAASFRVPSRAEVEAAVVLTGGRAWLEGEDEALAGVALPSVPEAEELVGRWLPDAAASAVPPPAGDVRSVDAVEPPPKAFAP